MIEMISESGNFGLAILLSSLLIASWNIFAPRGANRVLFLLPLLIGLAGTWLSYEEVNALRDGYGNADPEVLETGFRAARVPVVMGMVCTGLLWIVEWICLRFGKG